MVELRREPHLLGSEATQGQSNTQKQLSGEGCLLALLFGVVQGGGCGGKGWREQNLPTAAFIFLLWDILCSNRKDPQCQS